MGLEGRRTPVRSLPERLRRQRAPRGRAERKQPYAQIFFLFLPFFFPFLFPLLILLTHPPRPVLRSHRPTSSSSPPCRTICFAQFLQYTN
ncbi:hypothetical protein BDZ91DRAFT_211461 [Kalaharituber pfeilii]|nr:hypothetical protein BDZ91DRAFT_211461 [Kalaharituber pfeilii]